MEEKQVMEAGVDLYLEVYIDIIFILNFLMDMVLLVIVKKLLKCQSSRIRLIGGAAIGAVGACILSIFPNLNGFIQFFLAYVFICFAMIEITFRPKSLKAKGKAVIILYITTYFLGGFLNSLYYHTKLGFYFHELIQGKLFDNQNTTYFILAVITGFLAICIFISALRNLRKGNLDTYEVDLFFGDKSVRLTGLLDTGNSLYDPIYKKPVLIVEEDAIKSLLTIKQASLLRIMLDTVEGSKSEKQEVSMDDNMCDDYDTINIMMIPYHSIGRKRGMLPAIVMKRIDIWNGEEKTSSEKVYTAISRDKLSSKNDYQVILHKDII
ncbi:MAG: putative rane protein [Anaerocolumna sp.]|jgi:stage II sporulation protein GA (sporulation sigma-E factor processing peptidase)|nr:putative rane protein [Anaerocolumna sp.]